ncbi:MAG: hypothetical protein P4L35_19790 [Ignavibacteriaceae bacterium]|nr:hypothetical protein [Ignavibacteriaceae bacterium]
MNYIKIRERKRTNGRVYFFLDISRNGERRLKLQDYNSKFFHEFANYLIVN